MLQTSCTMLPTRSRCRDVADKLHDAANEKQTQR
jgi:hypothetical protein